MKVRTTLSSEKTWWLDILRCSFILSNIWKLPGHSKVYNIFNCVKDSFLFFSSSVLRECTSATLKRMVAQLLLTMCLCV